MQDVKNSQGLKALALVSSIGINFAASIYLGYYSGTYLDMRLHTEPAFLIIGLLLGIAAGVMGTVHLVESIWKEK